MDLAALNQTIQRLKLPDLIKKNLTSFITNYAFATSHATQDLTPLLAQYISFVQQEYLSPHAFSHFHPAERAPFDFYEFSLALIGPLLDARHSTVTGKENLDEICLALSRKENRILLANHQTEVDPQIISLLLTPTHPKLAASLVYLAGHRVTQDPIAIPFSRGTNILCIYSKKYIDSPPEEKGAKQVHNAKTMSKLQELLDIGGACIYVAPSGGRDRYDESGRPQVADFDPQSVEMFHLLAKKAHHPTTLHLLALSTIDLLPPPKTTRHELGEERLVSYSPAHLSFGPALDMDAIGTSTDKHERRKERSVWMTQMISSLLPSQDR